MRRSFWIAMITFGLFVTAPPSPRIASSIPAPPGEKECDCSNLKALQVELRNAVKLQQAFRNEAAVLRGMGSEASSQALQAFAQGAARQGLQTVPGYNGPSEVDYENKGSSLYDPTHPGKTFTPQQLCDMTSGATQTLNRVIAASACGGIGDALRAHEAVHQKSCLAKGFVPYFNMSGADRAAEEVEAYGAQIAVLRAELAKVLAKSEFHVIVDVTTRAQMPPNPLYTAINITNHGDVPMSHVTTASDLITLDGEGQQQTNGSIEGNCRFTGGLPSALTARGVIETDGLEAKIKYNVAGTTPSVMMECKVGNQTGHGMSIPVPINSNNDFDFSLVFEDGATKEFDQGAGEAAQIMARGGVKLSGRGIVRLVFCNSGK
jgi:hypothetical protein